MSSQLLHPKITCIEQEYPWGAQGSIETRRPAISALGGEQRMLGSIKLRTMLWTLHRWVGIGFAVLLVPISISGALLVWHDHLDALIHPSRYQVTGAGLTHP